MNLQDLIKEQNIIVSLTTEQLYEFASQILSGAQKIYEKVEEPEQYLTRRQTAQALDVDLSTLWRWNREAYLKPVQVGGRRMYKLSDINRILQKEVAV